MGQYGKIAEKIIEKENPRVDAIIVKVGTGVIENFSFNRVWVWVDDRGIVAQTPEIG